MFGRFVVLLLYVLLPLSTQGNVDPDYVDLSFECPFKAVCPQVCVPTPFDCPPSMQCMGNLTLCADGTCAEVCSANLVSPCSEECAPIACPLVIDNYDNCISLYGPLLMLAANCSSSDVTEEEVVSAGSRFSWHDPAYVAGYCWVTGVTAAIITWCWFK